MYPSRYFSLFPPFPRNRKVFVIMDFDARFQKRWKQVISPAIRSVADTDGPLDADRADISTMSDSILTDITRAISEDFLIFADISALDTLNNKPIRNGNAMYELGLAQALRQPEEVVVFRSDRQSLLFDVTHILVHSYDPDNNPSEAMVQVRDTLTSAARAVSLARNAAAERAAGSLDIGSVQLIPADDQPFTVDPTKGKPPYLQAGDMLPTVRRLLDLGIVETRIRRAPSLREMQEMAPYYITPFGRAVRELLITRQNPEPDNART